MKYAHIIIILTISTVVFSCSKWDDFLKYTEDGEIIYPGRMDSIKIYPGNERVRLEGLLTADPKVEKIVIRWNDDKDSAVFPYQKKNADKDTFSTVFPVDEGSKSFKIATYDQWGNSSVNVFAIGTSYGQNFRRKMQNRPISSIIYDSTGTSINWDPMDLSAGPQYTEIEIIKDGVTESIITPVSSETTFLENVTLIPPIKYRTIFKPEPNCIDTFATDFQLKNIQADVTNLYLSNAGPGFIRATEGGRWGTLASPWITNDAAKNKENKTTGGYSSDQRWWDTPGQIAWDTWGNTPVVDGKIYQVTSQPLPPGTYAVSFHYYSELQANSSVYCIAAAGKQGIPSLSGLSTALGYFSLYNKANIGETAPTFEGNQNFSFTLTQAQFVSIGFLGNIVGDKDPGSYLAVQNISLIKTN